MLSISKQLESRFSPDEIERIIASRLEKFNPVASAPGDLNGSIGCACNKLLNDDTCPEIDETSTVIGPDRMWSVASAGKTEIYKYEPVTLRR